jgi:hypothetical protein
MVLVNALADSVEPSIARSPIAAPSRKCCQILPGDQANPNCGAKSNLLGCVAPSPFGTAEPGPFTIGTRYCGSGRFEQNKPVSRS